jgi:hypothetical protein
MAIVGMKSNTLSKLAEGQKIHVQKALSNILGRSISVTIQLATATKTKAVTSPPPTPETCSFSAAPASPATSPIAPQTASPAPQVTSSPPSLVSAPPANNLVSSRVIADLNDEILEEVENDFEEEETTLLPWDEPAPLPPVVAEQPQPLSLFDAVPPPISASISIPVISPTPNTPVEQPEPTPNIPDSFTVEELDAAAQNLASRFGGEVVEEYVTLWDL